MRHSLLSLILLVTFAAAPAYALQQAGVSQAAAGETIVRTGVNYLAGLISPPASFTHVTGANKALLWEEYISASYGLGDWGLKDWELSVRATLFQSREESFGGALVHPEDNGFYASWRIAGNFVHAPRWTLGGWLQGDIPLVADTEKFVKPNLHLAGAGTQFTYQLLAPLVISQSLFVGSGLQDDEKNPQFISSTLGGFNFGQMLFDHDVTLTSGLVIEADLSSRTDPAYAASLLADGEIRNIIFILPILLNAPLTSRLSMAAGFAFKWMGQSVRGDQFANLELSYRF